jgi:hypothetical protein
VAVTDPVDARLLAALAELGKAAVHELAVKVGMDPREVAYRLIALSGSGLPLLVGVESEPNGLRPAIAGPWPNRNPAGPQGALQGAPLHSVQGTPSGAYNVQGTPSAATARRRLRRRWLRHPWSAPSQRPPAPPNQQFAPPTAPRPPIR